MFGYLREKKKKIKEAKAQLQLKLSSDTESQKGTLQVCQLQKEVGKIGGLLLDGGDNLVTNDTGKAQLVDNFFALIFEGKSSLHLQMNQHIVERRRTTSSEGATG